MGMDGKRQFSLRDLLSATVLIAVALALFRLYWLVHTSAPPGDQLSLRWLLALGAFACLGAGIATPMKRPVTGAFAGIAAILAVLIFLTFLSVLYVGF